MEKTVFTAGQIAEMVGGRVEGDASVRIEGIASLGAAGPGELTFAEDEKRALRLGDSRAGAAIVGELPDAAQMTLIRVENVQAAVARFLGALVGEEDLPPTGVHPTAVIAEDGELAEDAAIGPFVVIGPRARIGAGSVLCARAFLGAGTELGPGSVLHEGVVVKSGCKIGARVRIGPNSVIGHDGFGYYFADGVHQKIPHAGVVVIEDDVEIGACSCVDRAKFGETRIGAGTKIDNLVQVAHNVQTGKGCLLAGLVGVAGSARLGDHVVLGGHAGIRDNIAVGDRVQVSAYAAVAGDVPAGQAVGGIPAKPAKEQMRVMLSMPKLPDLLKRVRELEARIRILGSAEDNS